MRSKYVWMALSIIAIWLAVLFVGLFGATYEVAGAGEAYGLELGTSLGMLVGYLAVITTLFIFLPIEKIMGKARTDTQKKYAWVTLSIAAIWLAVLVIGSLGISYEVAGTGGAETVVVAVPVAYLAAIVTVVLAKFVAHFELG